MFFQQNELKLSVVSLKEIQENLKTKIVDSPEKVKNYKEKMKDTVQRLGSLVQYHVALTLLSSVIFYQLPTTAYNLVIPVCLMSGQLQVISLYLGIRPFDSCTANEFPLTFENPVPTYSIFFL